MFYVQEGLSIATGVSAFRFRVSPFALFSSFRSPISSSLSSKCRREEGEGRDAVFSSNLGEQNASAAWLLPFSISLSSLSLSRASGLSQARCYRFCTSVFGLTFFHHFFFPVFSVLQSKHMYVATYVKPDLQHESFRFSSRRQGGDRPELLTSWP